MTEATLGVAKSDGYTLRVLSARVPPPPGRAGHPTRLSPLDNIPLSAIMRAMGGWLGALCASPDAMSWPGDPTPYLRSMRLMFGMVVRMLLSLP